IVEPLVEALSDKKASVRYAAAVGLSGAGDERAIKPLEKATEDENSVVKNVAKMALNAIKERQ
ncbi:MAG: HEAT repeat domain-containing protein, partial [Methanobacterium sp.]